MVKKSKNSQKRTGAMQNLDWQPISSNYVDGNLSWTVGNSTWHRMCGSSLAAIGIPSQIIGDGSNWYLRKSRYRITFIYESPYTFSAQIGVVESHSVFTEQLNDESSIRTNLEAAISGPFEFKMLGTRKQAKLLSWNTTTHTGVWVISFVIDLSKEFNRWLQNLTADLSSDGDVDDHRMDIFWSLTRNDTTARTLYFSISSEFEAAERPNNVKQYSLKN